MTKLKSFWAKRLRRLRERHQLTQVAAAERTGVTPSAWIAWENSQRTPGRIARRLLLAAFSDLE